MELARFGKIKRTVTEAVSSSALSRNMLLNRAKFFLRKKFKNKKTRALWASIFLHLLILVILAIDLSQSSFDDDATIVSKLEIQLGTGYEVSIMPESEVTVYDTLPNLMTMVAESELAPVTKEAAQPTKQIKNDPTQPTIKKRSGSNYGNSVSGLVKAEDYLQLLGYLVQERALANIPRVKGRAVLNLHINRQGYVVKYALKKSSTQKEINNAAVEFAKKAMIEPLPPAPKNFDPKSKILKYDFTIYYD